jgi:hypothetical protein
MDYETVFFHRDLHRFDNRERVRIAGGFSQ